eukprot:TRINITY_DN9639_c0_g1_i1.p1 TRINITY_DN9639_c0_g1~~TRINITY_DN9639_c0_g1_i1.p1  ORF type:complete len:285 (+),score=66.38 TRINITY_DN9639_c0_g1_i1:99-953(+)
MRTTYVLAVAVLFGIVFALPFPGYNGSDALNYVYYSYSAYCPQRDVAAWDCSFCKGDTGGFVNTNYFTSSFYDTHVYVGYHPSRQEIVATFRGTVPTLIKNWLDDIVYIQKSGPFNGISVEVHDGFLQSYEAVASNVVAEIISLVGKFPGYDIVLTGHSLGAAQTTLLAMDLAYNHGINKSYVITFGSPRVGDPAFASAFNAVYAGRSWRVTHETDIVPHVPLQTMLTEKFHHVGTEVWYYDGNGDYKFGDGSGEDPNESDSNLTDFSIVDHLTYLGVLYIACL